MDSTCVYVSQVYRSVLLNNGRRTRTHTCTATTAVSDPSQNENESQDSSASQPFDIDQTAMELGDSNVDNILYRSDIDIGTRGDIIQFYNKIYIGYIKDFVLKLSPDDVSKDGWMDRWVGGWMNI